MTHQQSTKDQNGFAVFSFVRFNKRKKQTILLRVLIFVIPHSGPTTESVLESLGPGFLIGRMGKNRQFLAPFPQNGGFVHSLS